MHVIIVLQETLVNRFGFSVAEIIVAYLKLILHYRTGTVPSNPIQVR